jgi:hypothetical protein
MTIGKTRDKVVKSCDKIYKESMERVGTCIRVLMAGQRMEMALS